MPKQKSAKPKVFRIILLVIISLIIGLGIYNINARYVLHDPFPMVGGLGYSVILSGSMEPELSVDDLVIVQEQDQYSEGDIVVYPDKSIGVVCHRLISIDNQGNAITKGDANNTTDKSFDVKNVKGKVVFKVPMLGKLFNDYVLYVLIAVIAILLIISIVREMKSRDKDTKRIQDLKQEIEKLKQTSS